jgi:hypothetical protein
MLADISTPSHAGQLEPDILLPATARYELFEFIAAELPRWRDHPDRPPASAESTLTSQLCDHLNGAAYYSTTWSHVQFRTEVPDEVTGGRSIDLAAKPRGALLVIEGRRHTQFDTFLPIECKRLPTPMEKGRDEREYVITKHGTTGGIQRFKFGLHGAAHCLAGMIGYVQQQTCSYWSGQVNRWIQSLAAEADSVWTESDTIEPLSDDLAVGLAVLRSRHSRGSRLEDCELRHLWIKMN